MFSGNEVFSRVGGENHRTPKGYLFEASNNLSEGSGPSRIIEVAPSDTDSESHSEFML